MANLANAEARFQINQLIQECVNCTKPECPEWCHEFLQCELDRVIDDIRDGAKRKALKEVGA